MLPVYDQESFSHVSMPNSPGFGDGVEDPEAFAGADVEAAHVAFDVAVAFGDAAGAMRRADDDDILGDDGRGVEADLRRWSRSSWMVLVVIQFQIDRAVLSEGRDRRAGFGVRGRSGDSRA